MSTRSSTRNIFPPLDNPELTIQRRTRVDPNLLKDFNMATDVNGDNVPPAGGGDLPVPDLRTMKELCQPTLNGRGGPIAPIAIQATNFGLKNDMIQQDTFAQRSESSSSITSSSDPKIIALKAEMAEINKNLMKVLQINQQVKAVTHSCKTCGGPHSYNDCLATVGQTQNVYATRAYNQGGNSYQPQGNHNLLSYRLDNYLGPPEFNQIKTKAIQIKTTKIGIKETIMEILKGTTKEETNSSKELVMVQTSLQLIKHRLINPQVTKLRFSKPRFLNRKL
nr:hypothetical protein [Tanacetum cinerariifolium]